MWEHSRVVSSDVIDAIDAIEVILIIWKAVFLCCRREILVVRSN